MPAPATLTPAISRPGPATGSASPKAIALNPIAITLRSEMRRNARPATAAPAITHRLNGSSRSPAAAAPTPWSRWSSSVAIAIAELVVAVFANAAPTPVRSGR